MKRSSLACQFIGVVFLIFSAQTALAATKIPLDLFNQISNASSLELIVEYDDTEIKKTASIMRNKLPRRQDNDNIRAFKVTKYKLLKDQVDLGVTGPDIEPLESYSHLPIALKRFKSMAALNAFIAQPGVKAVYINQKMHLVLAPNLDSSLVGSLTLINQPAVSNVGEQGAGTTVAVIDNGIDFTNAAFGSCTSIGKPASCHVIVSKTMVNSALAGTNHIHGTNVAAIVLGVAPASQIAMLNVFDNRGFASSADIIAAINWSIANQTTYKIAAINMSLGGSDKFTSPCTNDWSTAPITEAKISGISVVVAAGNTAYTDGLSSPACSPDAISVGAVYESNMGGLNWGICTDYLTATDQPVCFSNSANYLTLLAPGVNITAANITVSGTSQATPHVAGAIAVLRSAFPAETLAQTQNRLTTSGVMVTDLRNNITKPRINLLEAARPANDSFANSTPILIATNATSGSTSGLSLLSSKESGEPNHAGNSGGDSVWWKWTAPANGQFSLDTHGSNFDTLLAIYRGNSISALSNIAANDNDGFGNGNSSLLLQAQTGQVYTIAVDGTNGLAGLVQLNWSLNTTANANLSIGIVGLGSPTQGSSTNYTITVSNAGPQVATNVYVNATLPTGASYVSSSSTCAVTSNIVSCLIGTLDSNSSNTLNMQLLWNSIGTNANIAVTASSDVPDTSTTNNTATLPVALTADNVNGDTPTLPEWGLALMMALLMTISAQTKKRHA